MLYVYLGLLVFSILLSCVLDNLNRKYNSDHKYDSLMDLTTYADILLLTIAYIEIGDLINANSGLYFLLYFVLLGLICVLSLIFESIDNGDRIKINKEKLCYRSLYMVVFLINVFLLIILFRMCFPTFLDLLTLMHTVK